MLLPIIASTSFSVSRFTPLIAPLSTISFIRIISSFIFITLSRISPNSLLASHSFTKRITSPFISSTMRSTDGTTDCRMLP